MALAKATTNKKHCQDPIALDPIFLAPYRQTQLYKLCRSIYLFLPRFNLYNPFTPLTAGRFYPRVPFIIRKFHGQVLHYISTTKYYALA